MKIKVLEATSIQLNFMVAKATGMIVVNQNGGVFWGNFATVTPVTSWAQAGPIIESEKIDLFCSGYSWTASTGDCAVNVITTGPTPLIAAMRCFVTSKLGDEIEVADELCEA